MTDQEFLYYQRQIMVPEISEAGQDKLINSQVLIIGCGGLGASVSLFLAGAGIGKIVLADGDKVEESNLQRQVIYRGFDIDKNKALAAAKQLKTLNPHIHVRSISKNLTDKQLSIEVMMADLVLDCTDSFPVRQEINQACVESKTPLISASAIGWVGQLMSFDFSKNTTPCYQCVVTHQDNRQGLKCSESGVIGPVVGTMGNMQALEAIKFLTKNKHFQPNVLSLFDGQYLSWQQFKISSKKDCPICQSN